MAHRTMACAAEDMLAGTESASMASQGSSRRGCRELDLRDIALPTLSLAAPIARSKVIELILRHSSSERKSNDAHWALHPSTLSFDRTHCRQIEPINAMQECKSET